MTSIDYSAYQGFFTAIQHQDLNSWDFSTLEKLVQSAQQNLSDGLLGNLEEQQEGTFSGLLGVLRRQYGDDGLPLRLYWLLTGGYPDAWVEGEWFVVEHDRRRFYSDTNHREAQWAPYPADDGRADISELDNTGGDHYTGGGAAQPVQDDITEWVDLIAEALVDAGLEDISEDELAGAISNLVGAGQH
ncbi:hypothetical protein [Streptomyces sp. NPDC047981]|uniref:hypothetical protein n=1 Tax=Streptomyces sp. NPDC047981 TaxID=3154610 RepID=UPI00344852BD